MTYLRIIFTSLLAVAAMVLSTSAYAALEKRVALVIGNGAYTNAPALANPVTDARAMADKMRAMGFEIVEGYDLDKGGLERTVREFAKTSKDADLSLFFYAGHGIAVENKNYLIPVDARFEDSSALDFEAIPVNLVTRQMQYSQGVSLVFLDACRDNPLAQALSRSMGGGTRSSGIGSGLAAMKISNPGKGLAIAFATSPGAVAYDGSGKHSPFTDALLKHIDEPNTDITEIMSRVTGEVVKTTNQKQRPWLNTSLTGSVILNRVEEITAGQQPASLDLDEKRPVVSSANTLERQKVLYNLARETGQA
ncbi:MAG: caspase family protein, partial [Rhizobiaceae bacterium]